MVSASIKPSCFIEVIKELSKPAEKEKEPLAGRLFRREQIIIQDSIKKSN